MLKVLVIMSAMVAGAALAVPADPAPDHIGVYFDTDATSTDLESTPGVPFHAYVIVTNPTGASVGGAELGYRLDVPAGSEGALTRLGHDGPFQSVDLGNSEDPRQGDYIVGLATPLPSTATVVLVTWQFVLAEDVPVSILLGPASVQSIDDGLPAYLAGDAMVPLIPSSGDVDVPVATINGGVTDVPGAAVRRAVVLEQCRPNPFNPRTTIRYALIRSGRVTLSVHDVSGKSVRVLVDGDVVSPGEHEVEWDGLDATGRAVASGTYFCRIEALGVSATRRMILVR